MRIILCLFLSILFTASTYYSPEVDISWDFDNGLDGWCNATAEEMQMEVRLEYNELRATIVGSNPNFDSPSMLVMASFSHFVVIRMLYFGDAKSAALLLRAGSGHPLYVENNHKRGDWEIVHTTTIITATEAYSDSASAVNMLDNNIYTYYSTATTVNSAEIVFDLGQYRWVKGLKIFPMGDARSPRNCVLQKSITTGAGPFVTVKTFTLPNSTTTVYVNNGNSSSTLPPEFDVTGFVDSARYWRLLILDTYGGIGLAIREVAFQAIYDKVSVVPFLVSNTGLYRNYYLPINQFMQGPIARMRFEIIYPNGKGKVFRDGLAVDYIRIVRAPNVWRVRGCLDKYYLHRGFQGDASYNVTTTVDWINGVQPLSFLSKNNMSQPYATSYDCPLSGGNDVLIEGSNFGTSARVFVNGNDECVVKSNVIIGDDPEGKIHAVTCTLPPGIPGQARLKVQNGVLPGLFQESSTLSYRTAPPAPDPPTLSNIATHSIDLAWFPPGDVFSNMAITGYKLLWFDPRFPDRVNNITLGNVTKTSVRGLLPSTAYRFAIAAVAEGALTYVRPLPNAEVLNDGDGGNSGLGTDCGFSHAALPTDLYGRRDLTANALVGGFSVLTNATTTASVDFQFTFFTANATLNYSSPYKLSSDGPTGNFGSEGAYGLILLGDANIQNCNSSVTCCDGYNVTIGPSSCGLESITCSVRKDKGSQGELVVDGQTRRRWPSNIPGGQTHVVVQSLSSLRATPRAVLPTASCGPSLRLTPSSARLTGASWYARKMNINEGFDTTLSFQISNPSLTCDHMDDVDTFCRSRGADGLAFVIQDYGPTAIGRSGGGLGYDGIMNSLVVEIDTFSNFDLLDVYENHVSVMTQGWRYNASSNHSRSLGSSTRVPDLTDNKHTLRVRYSPVFDEDAVKHPAFQANEYSARFFENADFSGGGEGDWGSGIGTLYVYLDDLYTPIIITALNLDKTLQLDHGRAFIGITAATGHNHWQTHDVLSWSFTSLYVDQLYTAPLLVNNGGDHRCINETVCVNRVDYEHYVRRNNLWGNDGMGSGM